MHLVKQEIARLDAGSPIVCDRRLRLRTVNPEERARIWRRSCWPGAAAARNCCSRKRTGFAAGALMRDRAFANVRLAELAAEVLVRAGTPAVRLSRSVRLSIFRLAVPHSGGGLAALSV